MAAPQGPCLRRLGEGATALALLFASGTQLGALGLVPFLFATGPGSEVQRPLAIVVIGGLVTSTLLTLLVVPALYGMFEGRSTGDFPAMPLEEVESH